MRKWAWRDWLGFFTIILFMVPFSNGMLDSTENGGLEIHHGQNAGEGRFPYVVGISYDEKFLCAGTILTPNKILTSCHCLDDLEINGTYVKEKFWILVGGYRFETGDIYTVADIKPHKLYDPESKKFDVAVFTLTDPINMHDPDRPAATINIANNFLGKNSHCRFAGWGQDYDDKGGTNPPNLLKTFLVNIELEDCQKIVVGGVDNTFICTKPSIVADANPCRGDSGGGLFCRDSGEWKVYGTMSWGFRRCNFTTAIDLFSNVMQKDIRKFIIDNIKFYKRDEKDGNSGDGNGGDGNGGNANRGDRNDGDANDGDGNGGEGNGGDGNGGNANRGNANRGDRNDGDANDGDGNGGEGIDGDRIDGDKN